MSDTEFLEHCAKVASEVIEWPEWKRNLLGPINADEVREFIEQFQKEEE